MASPEAAEPGDAAVPPLAMPLGRALRDDGRRFAVPDTPDLLEHLFSTKRKTLLDLPILLPIAVQIAVFMFLRPPKWAFLASFLLWRAAYNAGLGYILHRQSQGGAFLGWFSAAGFGLSEAELAASKLPAWKKALVLLFRSELEEHLAEVADAKSGRPPPPVDDLSPEFKGWMLFRFLVDTVLLNDFFAYVIMALAYFVWPTSFSLADLGRYVAGFLLIYFNVWVKLDAHRVVRDYAWYWGDFFFLPASSSSLTFDGVFELAPHPMYSIGYLGYYGISLISGSYTVLYASLAAHAAQFAFLYFVEDPHIEKVYGSGGRGEREQLRNYFRRDLLVFRNLDPLRTTDLLTILALLQTVTISLLLLRLPNPVPYLALQAVLWRLLWTCGLGAVLRAQSRDGWWNRYHVGRGETAAQAFSHWKSFYNLGMVQTYASFWALAWGCYRLPAWGELGGATLLRHTVGGLLVLLHVWAAAAIHEALGDFGWFYGDFFLPQKTGLKWGGIYRFLNNPEKVLGHASFYAASLLTLSPTVFAVSLLSHGLSILFLELVERPHMAKVYGTDQLRRKGGVEKVILGQVKETLDNSPPFVREIVEKVGEAVDAAAEAVDRAGKEVFGDTEARRLLLDAVPGLRRLVERRADRSGLRRRRRRHADGDESDGSTAANSPSPSDTPYPRSPSPFTSEAARAVSARTFAGLAELLPARLVAEVLPPDLAGAFLPDAALLPKDLDPSLYSVTVEAHNGKVRWGEPIRVRFRCPPTASRRDWIGLYRAGENARAKWTNRRSRGRWYWITGSHEPPVDPPAGKWPLEQEGEACVGEVVFEGPRSAWVPGMWEARYHHDGAYGVVTVSEPFEIEVSKFEGDTASSEQIAAHLLSLARPALFVPATTELTPTTELVDLVPGPPAKPEDSFRRLVDGIRGAFGVQIKWHVAEHAGSVGKLAEAVGEALRVSSGHGNAAQEPEEDDEDGGNGKDD
ncbi:phospholipid methyltransferase-domain-containing protein [Hyaloraphidium curvatum]|nr:phospholipid methyltransferase-domain-containing protein [Hyaloraphidium curvatum]